MKINDKNLISYGKNHENIDKEGYLLKRGENSRSFQKRWFVLKGNLLFYFEKSGDPEPIGVIILEGCTTELAESSEHFLFRIIFQSCISRSYELAAESQEKLESWMLSIARASYDYLKLLVSELQKNLEEAQDKEKSNKDGIFIAPVTFMTPTNRNKRINPFNNSSERTYSEMWDYGASQSTHDGLMLETCQNVGSGVNNVIPPSIPFRTAPPPPTVRNRIVTKNLSKNNFKYLHNIYGEHIKDVKCILVNECSNNVTQLLEYCAINENDAVVNLIGI